MRLASLFFATIILTIGTSLRAQTNDPSPDQFVDVKHEPQELTPLERLVVYPEEARRNMLEGTVALTALVDIDGSVKKVEIIHSDSSIFDQAAIDAMMKERFTPAMYNGQPLKVWITRRINFRLNNTSESNSPQRLDNALKRQNNGPIDFGKFVGMSLDSTRHFFDMYPENRTETKERDGIHLHGEGSRSFLPNLTRTADGIVGKSGLIELTLDYYAKNDTVFKGFAGMWGARSASNGKLLTQSSETELPNEIISVAADGNKRTIRVKITPKQ